MASEQRIPLEDETQAMSSNPEKSSGKRQFGKVFSVLSDSLAPILSGKRHSSGKMSSELESSDRTMEADRWGSILSGKSLSSGKLSSELESSGRTMEADRWASILSVSSPERRISEEKSNEDRMALEVEQFIEKYYDNIGQERTRTRVRAGGKYPEESVDELDLDTAERLRKEEAKCCTPQAAPVGPHHYGKSHLVEMTGRLDLGKSSEETNKLLEESEEELQSDLERRLENLPLRKQHAIYPLPSSCSEDPYFTPRAVSIGPYHHGKTHLAKMECHKNRFVKNFILRNPGKSFEQYCDELKRIEPEVRKYYSLKVDFTSSSFVEMMLLDGCFILELLITFYYGIPDEIFDDNSFSQRIKTDLLMFANQIPFMVLLELHELANTGSLPCIYQLLVNYFWDTSNSWPMLRSSGAHNLLHFYHLQFSPPFVNEHLTDKSSKKKCRAKLNEKFVTQVPSAEQLEKAGVIFRGKRTTHFLDIKFRDGILEIPTISLDEPFLLLLVNLVMYEKLNVAVGKVVQTYCCFMHCLLKNPYDVQLLRMNGVIESNSISIEELRYQFDRFQNPDYLNTEKHYFADLFVDLWEFCQKKTSVKWSSFFGKVYVVLSSASANVQKRNPFARHPERRRVSLIFALFAALLLSNIFTNYLSQLLVSKYDI